MNAIVLAFDRLPVGFLGCYGNAWIETPHFDRLAAQSIVFDQHFATELRADGPGSAWWTGRFDLGRSATQPRLPEILRTNGIAFRCLREAGSIEQTADVAAETVEGEDGLDVAMEETPFHRLVARARQELRRLQTSRQEPWMLWLQSRGVPTPWIPPRPFATRYLDLDDGDEDEADEAEEDVENGEDDDSHDEGDTLELSAAELDQFLISLASMPAGRAQRDALGEAHRVVMRKLVGGYVALLDAGLGLLLAAIDSIVAASPTLVIVTAARGLTVREPGILRDAWEPFAEENVHTPFFVRPPGMKAGRRCQALAQPVDLVPTLAGWFQLDVSDLSLDGRNLLAAAPLPTGAPLRTGPPADSERAAAFIGDGSSRAGIRTPDHYLVLDRAEDKSSDATDTPGRHLFIKPEDVWETNDVAAQNPDLVDRLSAELGDHFRRDESNEGATSDALGDDRP